MADITTVEGLKVLFDAAAISAIAGSDGQTGVTGAVIYGLGPEDRQSMSRPLRSSSG